MIKLNSFISITSYLFLAFSFLLLGCGDDNNSSTASEDTGSANEDDTSTVPEQVITVDLDEPDCDTYFSAEDQKVNVTVTGNFIIPADYDGPEEPWGLALSFSDDDTIPVTATPGGNCRTVRDAVISPGASSPYTTDYIEKMGNYPGTLCGENLYAAAAIFEYVESFPADAEWVWFSSEKLPVGAGNIDLGDMYLVRNK